MASRAEAVARLTEPFAAAARDLGLGESGEIAYRPRGPLAAAELLEELARRRQADLGRAYLSFGPQLDEVTLELGGRALRRFGSQGQQRIALLALLFAEREALIDAGRAAPLMLLDDVMSELDPEHRTLLLARLAGAGQAVITATEPEAVPNTIPWTSLALHEGRVGGRVLPLALEGAAAGPGRLRPGGYEAEEPAADEAAGL